jgi:hypothetical protein
MDKQSAGFDVGTGGLAVDCHGHNGHARSPLNVFLSLDAGPGGVKRGAERP